VRDVIEIPNIREKIRIELSQFFQIHYGTKIYHAVSRDLSQKWIIQFGNNNNREKKDSNSDLHDYHQQEQQQEQEQEQQEQEEQEQQSQPNPQFPPLSASIETIRQALWNHNNTGCNVNNKNNSTNSFNNSPPLHNSLIKSTGETNDVFRRDSDVFGGSCNSEENERAAGNLTLSSLQSKEEKKDKEGEEENLMERYREKIECVLIPEDKKSVSKKRRSTLCLSSQVLQLLFSINYLLFVLWLCLNTM